MSTLQTRQEIRTTKLGGGSENTTRIPRRKIKDTIVMKRSALVEISNTYKHETINIKNSLKVNYKDRIKRVEINDKVLIQKTAVSDKVSVEKTAVSDKVLVQKSAVCDKDLVQKTAINDKVLVQKIAVSDKLLVQKIADSDKDLVQKTAVSDKVLIQKSAVSDKDLVQETAVNVTDLVQKTSINDKVLVQKTAVSDKLLVQKIAVSDKYLVQKTAVSDKLLVQETAVYDKIINNSSLKKYDDDSKVKPIENIDEFFRNNLFLVPEYAEDIYNYLRQLELKYKIKRWPLNINVNEEMRGTLIEWLVEIHLEYDLLQETLHLAVSLLDRYLQISNDVTVKNLQLIGACCMCLAAKYEEVQPLSVSDFLYLCNDAYTICEYLKMERKILNAINFEIARPLSIYFLRRYSLANKVERRQHICSKYLLDLALLDATLCHVRPSLLAACALFIATCLINDKIDQKFWTKQLIYYSKYEYENIRIYMGKLSKLVMSNRNYLQTVKKKYSAKELDSISNEIHTKMQLLNGFCEKKPRG